MWIEATAAAGYSWAGLRSFESPPSVMALDAVRAGATLSAFGAKTFGTLETGLGLVFSYDYMTDFVPDAERAYYDHDLMLLGFQGRAEVSPLSWLRPFALLEIDAGQVQVFNAIHAFDGSLDLAFGAQAALGIAIVPFRWETQGTPFEMFISPRGVARWLFLEEVGYWSLEAGADIGVRMGSR
jgi:hypothetical protein